MLLLKIVVQDLGIKHHHIIEFSIEEGMDAIRDVIYHLESYDITTIRASVPQYLMAKYISTKTDIKVLYSGEGSDEIFAGYQYSKSAPSAEALYEDGKRLISELYLYDNLRTDRTTAAWGLEVRIPFLDKKFLSYAMSINPEYKVCNADIIEKNIIRETFQGYLPQQILYRRKEAFSDAVSSKEISWYKSLATIIGGIITDDQLESAKVQYTHNTPMTKEALYYRNIFSEFYPGRDFLIPHYWMPKWQEPGLNDPSATVLQCHKVD